MAQLPKPRPLHERVEPGQRAHLEARPAVEEPEPEHIVAQETQRAAGQQAAETGSLPLLVPTFGLAQGVAVELAKVLVVRPVGVMEETPSETPDVAGGNGRASVVARARVMGQVAAEQPKHAVGLPPAEADAMAEKVVHATDPVAVSRGSAEEEVADLRGQGRGHSLVGVDDQDPRVLGLGNRPVEETAVADVFAPDHAANADPADDLQRAVGRAGVGHEDLVGHGADRLDRGANVASFVLAGDEDGQFRGR